MEGNRNVLANYYRFIYTFSPSDMRFEKRIVKIIGQLFSVDNQAQFLPVWFCNGSSRTLAIIILVNDPLMVFQCKTYST